MPKPKSLSAEDYLRRCSQVHAATSELAEAVTRQRAYLEQRARAAYENPALMAQWHGRLSLLDFQWGEACAAVASRAGLTGMFGNPGAKPRELLTPHGPVSRTNVGRAAKQLRAALREKTRDVERITQAIVAIQHLDLQGMNEAERSRVLDEARTKAKLYSTRRQSHTWTRILNDYARYLGISARELRRIACL